jgi:amino acid adenylation domain-containing protein
MIARAPRRSAGREAAAAAPAARGGEPATPGDEARQQVLVESSRAALDCPRGATVPELFDARVGERPEAIAVSFAGEHLTYAELDRRADRLARHLQALGVGPEVPVAICVERSLEMVVGVLAILKAGGAYVPLEPTYPRDRLEFMLEDTRAPVLLTQERLRTTLPAYAGRVVCLDVDGPALACRPAEGPAGGAGPEHLAYILYTSGSTGEPKAVAMSHRPLVNLLSWQCRATTLRRGARTLQYAPLGFDVSFQEMFFTWCSGGTLVLLADSVRRDAVDLLSFVADQRIERLFLPFVALNCLAEVGSRSDVVPVDLREVITAGEQLHLSRAIVEWFERLGDCVLHNQYGPTESHVVTALTLGGPLTDWPALPPIGGPIANTRIHLLDGGLRPVPVGMPGELHIGGVSLARGYLDRPDLTARRFVPDPFAGEPGARLYKTGDVARVRADGLIEYLGRADRQVKIRGFRVEPGEVEAAIARHDRVRAAVVLTEDDPTGATRLVAYVVADAEAQEVTPALRAHLQRTLPPYMIPSAFVLLEALPLTPNGKVDHRALEVARRRATRPAGPDQGPRGELEQLVTGLWAETLGLDAIGRDDNFFELGGNSLLALRVTARVAEACGVRVPARPFYEEPTVAGLARAIAERRAAADRAGSAGAADSQDER